MIRRRLAAPGPSLSATRAKGAVDCGAHPGAAGLEALAPAVRHGDDQ
jgi:hypothetical protein